MFKMSDIIHDIIQLTKHYSNMSENLLSEIKILRAVGYILTTLKHTGNQTFYTYNSTSSPSYFKRLHKNRKDTGIRISPYLPEVIRVLYPNETNYREIYNSTNIIDRTANNVNKIILTYNKLDKVNVINTIDVIGVGLKIIYSLPQVFPPRTNSLLNLSIQTKDYLVYQVAHLLTIEYGASLNQPELTRLYDLSLVNPTVSISWDEYTEQLKKKIPYRKNS